MKKTYNNPMLTFVSIKCNDIVTGSPVLTTTIYTEGSVLSADRFREDWDVY